MQTQLQDADGDAQRRTGDVSRRWPHVGCEMAEPNRTEAESMTCAALSLGRVGHPPAGEGNRASQNHWAALGELPRRPRLRTRCFQAALIPTSTSRVTIAAFDANDRCGDPGDLAVAMTRYALRHSKPRRAALHLVFVRRDGSARSTATSTRGACPVCSARRSVNPSKSP